MTNGKDYDAIVIGGGPAGSTAATTLAMKGRNVLLLEREKFPRYHIGESLLPYAYGTLERLGVLEKMKTSHFTKKYSVQFVSSRGKLSVPFYFVEQLKHESSMTWQVLRSEFDELLLDNSREKGVEVIEEINVRDLIYSNGAVVGVRAVDSNGVPWEFNAPVTIDATGRDAFAIAKLGWKERDPYLNKIAVWTYYRSALRDPGIDEGATTVAYVPDKGWFWYIPLAGDIVSCGIVAEKDYLYKESKDLKEVFDRAVLDNKWIEQHLAAGEQFGPYRVTGEYSYRSRHCATDGMILAGDAFQFLDPVFSSGVFLALRGGEFAAQAVDEALTAGDVSATRFLPYGVRCCEGVESMRRLVYAFYNTAFSFREFLLEYPHLKGDMTECLMGNLYQDFKPLWEAVSKFIEVPAALSYGKPSAAEEAMANAADRQPSV